MQLPLVLRIQTIYASHFTVCTRSPRNLKAKRTRLFALNDDAPALKDNLMEPPFLRRLPPTKKTFVTTRRTASRVNVATHSTYSETLLVDGVPANTIIMSPHPQQPQKRQIAGLCDGNGSDGQVVLISAVLDSAIRTGHLTISDSEGTHYYGKY